MNADQWIDVAIAPATGGLDAIAAYLNLTVTGSDAGGWAVAYAAGAQRPSTSSVNWAAGQTVANFAVSEIGTAAGQPALRVYAAVTTHLLVDITAIYGSLPAGNLAVARMSEKARALRTPVRISKEQLTGR